MKESSKYKLFTEIAEKNPHEFYSKLVSAYKDYDNKQKSIIKKLEQENKKLKVKVGQLESYVEEIVSEDFVVISKTTIKAYKDKIKNLNQACLLTERKLIECLYPQYSDKSLPKGENK